MSLYQRRACILTTSKPNPNPKKKKKKPRGQRTCIAERLRNEFIELAVRCVRLVKLDGMERWMAKLAGCRGVTWGGEGRGAHLSSKTHKLIPNQVVFTTLERNPHCDAFVDRCHQEVQKGLKKKKCINESVQHVSSSHIQILLLIFLELCSKGKSKYQMKGNS